MKVRVGAITALASLTAAAASGAISASASNATVCSGSRIVFMQEGSGPPVVYTMTAQGRNLRSIGFGHAPAWSPDGRWIAFDDGQHILRMRPDGSDVTDLTPTLANVFSLDPAWSPDGRWIVFASEPSGTRNAALWLVRADGAGLHELVNAPGEEEHPSWSPDGSRIVFDSLPAAGPDHLFTVRANGRDLDRITPDGLDAWGPSWSSQNLIAFADGASSATSDILTMHPDGSHLRQLTHAPQGVTIGLPGFSPSGANITFTRFNKAFTQSEIFRMTNGGQDVRDLTAGQTGFNLGSQWGVCG